MDKMFVCAYGGYSGGRGGGRDGGHGGGHGGSSLDDH